MQAVYRWDRGEKTGHKRHHSSPNFGSDHADSEVYKGSGERSEEMSNGEVSVNREIIEVNNNNATEQVEQVSVALKALAESVQKV